jgi:hypothetical protein
MSVKKVKKKGGNNLSSNQPYLYLKFEKLMAPLIKNKLSSNIHFGPASLNMGF